MSRPAIGGQQTRPRLVEKEPQTMTLGTALGSVLDTLETESSITPTGRGHGSCSAV